MKLMILKELIQSLLKKTEKKTHFLGISSVRTVFTFAMPGVKNQQSLNHVLFSY